MTSRTVIPFDRETRLMQKARALMIAPERFIADVVQGLPILVRALSVADEEDKNTIIALMGAAGADAVVWPLFHVMTDAAETEETRFHAAMQLSLVMPGVSDTGEIGRRLEQDMNHPDPVVRRNAAVAYGWEGNARATAFLVALIHQGDPDVQEDAVTALANLNTAGGFLRLKSCYDTGGIDQKRVILYNLWRVTRQRDAVLKLVVSALSEADDGLRLDAMIVFCTLADPERHHRVYLSLLNDPVAAIRELSLKQLDRLAREMRASIRERIAPLSDDPHPAVRTLARRWLLNPAQPPDMI